jgi:hypothetical protein
MTRLAATKNDVTLGLELETSNINALRDAPERMSMENRISDKLSSLGLGVNL